jgi:Ribonuclease G/E
LLNRKNKKERTAKKQAMRNEEDIDQMGQMAMTTGEGADVEEDDSENAGAVLRGPQIGSKVLQRK